MYWTAIQILGLSLYPFYSSCFSLPSLSVPARSHHNITVPSPDGIRIHIKCYTQPPRPHERLPDAGLEDCYNTLQYLLRGDKAMAPMRFTTETTGGFKVPFAWGHNSCAITITVAKPHAVGTFQFVLLAHLAAEVIEGCIKDATSNLGGQAKLGDEDQFEILVTGTGYKPRDLGVVGNQTDGSIAEQRR
ncbi:MAG: hypothetical protein LQ350_003861 [Teloschistes chrysophthalmus]|nr:MAG: hypothetical protein LQ350_003861 [Niorma chrysophthalma]